MKYSIIGQIEKNYYWFWWQYIAQFLDIQILANTLIFKLKEYEKLKHNFIEILLMVMKSAIFVRHFGRHAILNTTCVNWLRSCLKQQFNTFQIWQHIYSVSGIHANRIFNGGPMLVLHHLLDMFFHYQLLLKVGSKLSGKKRCIIYIIIKRTIAACTDVHNRYTKKKLFQLISVMFFIRNTRMCIYLMLILSICNICLDWLI